LIRRSQFVPRGRTRFLLAVLVTTKDEIADPHELQVRSWVNGEAGQDYSTKYMAHRIPDQIAWVSRFIQLQPGDVVATGTYHQKLRR